MWTEKRTKRRGKLLTRYQIFNSTTGKGWYTQAPFKYTFFICLEAPRGLAEIDRIKDQSYSWIFGNSSVRVGTQGLFRPYLKTFVAPFLPTRLTAPGSPRMRIKRKKKIDGTFRSCNPTAASSPTSTKLSLPSVESGFCILGQAVWMC